MKLLHDVDQPGAAIDEYVAQLDSLLLAKMEVCLSFSCQVHIPKLIVFFLLPDHRITARKTEGLPTTSPGGGNPESQLPQGRAVNPIYELVS